MIAYLSVVIITCKYNKCCSNNKCCIETLFTKGGERHVGLTTDANERTFLIVFENADGSQLCSIDQDVAGGIDRIIAASLVLAPSAAHILPWRFLVIDKNIII